MRSFKEYFFVTDLQLKMRTGGLQKHHRRSEERRSRSESQLSESSQTEQAMPSEGAVVSSTEPPTTGDQEQTTDALSSIDTQEQTIVMNGGDSTPDQQTNVTAQRSPENGEPTAGSGM